MIESYIEKDIMRQIKLMEYLLELKRIRIQTIADLLGVAKITVRRDAEKLLYMQPEMKVLFEDNNTLEVCFSESITRYDLVKRLYNQSYFLRICAYYLLGETNYLKIARKEHISTSKVFKLKKKVEKFFIAIGIMDESRKFLEDELRKRMIVLSIWMRTDTFNDKLDYRLFGEAKYIVKNFMNVFSNTLSKREQHFFRLAIYLSLKRQDKNVNITEQNPYMEKGFMYPKIKEILADYNLNDNEIKYIAMMYRLLNQNPNNYRHLVIDYESQRKILISDIPELKELVHMFEIYFNCELSKDIMFEKPFLRFIISTYLERQMFLVEKHYFLSDQQRSLCSKVEEVMLEWNNKHSFNIQLSKQTTEKFCVQVSELLLHNRSKNWNIFIVAENEYSHIAYREWIERKLNTEHIIVDSTLYYSIEELPVYINVMSSLIICERILMNNIHKNIRDSKTFPVSLSSVNKDLQYFFEYIFHLQ
ncbi:DeoR family transcriptional regulator [Enterococcus faecium]|uniref:DeoR family transcriptional regulator n=1 Tax=Enterococcus faecium TaxID=1352 RepID=UPI0002A32EC7|nr:DeoR family transcriptional regulator [Enterococcus faecium]ELA93959.1 hypothetical protein OIA_05142 [Enterococcus faecium EnGen0018]